MTQKFAEAELPGKRWGGENPNLEFSLRESARDTRLVDPFFLAISLWDMVDGPVALGVLKDGHVGSEWFSEAVSRSVPNHAQEPITVLVHCNDSGLS